jgi:hypothetical protein
MLLKTLLQQSLYVLRLTVKFYFGGKSRAAVIGKQTKDTRRKLAATLTKDTLESEQLLNKNKDFPVSVEI